MQDGLPEAGDVIADKYVVEHVLGRGGMGTVYSVTHRLTGKRLALKCLLPLYVNNPNIVERFLREARAAGRIQHRHVIDVFDVGRDADVLYIVMSLLQGMPLAELLHDEHLTLDEALVILVRAMEGVAAAHDHGIVHRDLKPGNIFVCLGVSGRLDDPRVLDFGISKLDDELNSPLTRSGVAVGTPYYMALEQLTGERDLDHRVDVYALGVILYEAMVGRLPHTAENVAALAIRLMHTPPTHLGSLRADLPPGLADVVMRALARDREARYPSVRALIDAILPFVPKSAGLTMPDPQGKPLRTPRDTQEPALPSEMARASATTAPSARRTLQTPIVSSDAPTTNSAEAQASVRPRDTRSTRTSQLVGLAGLATVAALAGSSLLRQADDETRTAQGDPLLRPSLQAGVSALDASAREASGEPTGEQVAAVRVGAASEWLDASGAPARNDVAVPAAAPAAARPRKRASPVPHTTTVTVSATEPATAAPDASPTTEALPDKPAKQVASDPSRAGSLAPEEF